MKGHTPEPWGVLAHFPDYVVPSTHRDRRNGGAADDIVDRDEYAQIIVRVREDRHGRGDTKANAARIVACVNACARINPEAVPDLLKLAKAMLLFYDELLADDAFTSEQDNYVNPLRAIIAKAEDCG